MYITVGISPQAGLFIFIKWVSNTFAFRKNLKDSDTFLRVPLSIFFVRSYLEEAPKFLDNFISLSIYARAAAVFSSALYSLWYLLLFLDCWHLPDCLAAFWWDSTPLLSLHDRGSKFLRRTASRLWVMSWEVFSLTSVLDVLWRRSYQWDYSLLSGGLSFVAIFPHVIRGGEN